MKFENVFPLILIALQFAACIGYVPSGDWRMCVYWFAAAAVLNLVVTV